VHARVLILGAGFGGLELATMLSEGLGEDAEVVIVDRSDAFVFGYSKLDLMFGRVRPEEIRLPYADFGKPGVRLLRETVTAIEPESRRVTTDQGVHEGDVLVVALGADYDFEATPGLAEGENEFYSVAGAERLREILPTFTEGRAVVGVCGAPFKCPPAPSEAALLLHDFLTERGVRDACEITLVMPFGTPVPPSPDTSAALLEAFAERGIAFVSERRVRAFDTSRAVVVLDDDQELPCDLFLGVPRHRAPDVVVASGMAEDGYVPVDSRTLATRFPDVYAVGDVATPGTPKAGVFSEGAARVVAAQLLARMAAGPEPSPYEGRGSCYVEFGAGRIGRVDVDFLSGPRPTGTFQEPSQELVAEKREFGSSRRARWFGR
jgi:sulfide:quinone oxidoreductase